MPAHSRSHTLKVLAVDDQISLTTMMQMMLQSLGHEVRVANTGLEGLQVLRRESVDLVITDLRMPGMDGLQFACGVKAINPDTPVALVTATLPDEDATALKQQGIDAMLQKPFRLQELAGILDAMQAGAGRA